MAKMTDEEKRIANEKRNAAKKVIRAFMAELTEDQKELKDALTLIVGNGQRGSNGPRAASVINLIRDLFLEKESVDEFEIFKAFKLGRYAMVIKCRSLVKDVEPDERVWVQFNPETETYDLLGTGAEMPEGWTGYNPDANDL